MNGMTTHIVTVRQLAQLERFVQSALKIIGRPATRFVDVPLLIRIAEEFNKYDQLHKIDFRVWIYLNTLPVPVPLPRGMPNFHIGLKCALNAIMFALYNLRTTQQLCQTSKQLISPILGFMSKLQSAFDKGLVIENELYESFLMAVGIKTKQQETLHNRLQFFTKPNINDIWPEIAKYTAAQKADIVSNDAAYMATMLEFNEKLQRKQMELLDAIMMAIQSIQETYTQIDDGILEEQLRKPMSEILRGSRRSTTERNQNIMILFNNLKQFLPQTTAKNTLFNAVTHYYDAMYTQFMVSGIRELKLDDIGNIADKSYYQDLGVIDQFLSDFGIFKDYFFLVPENFETRIRWITLEDYNRMAIPDTATVLIFNIESIYESYPLTFQLPNRGVFQLRNVIMRNHDNPHFYCYCLIGGLWYRCDDKNVEQLVNADPVIRLDPIDNKTQYTVTGRNTDILKQIQLDSFQLGWREPLPDEYSKYSMGRCFVKMLFYERIQPPSPPVPSFFGKTRFKPFPPTLYEAPRSLTPIDEKLGIFQDADNNFYVVDRDKCDYRYFHYTHVIMTEEDKKTLDDDDDKDTDDCQAKALKRATKYASKECK